MCTLYVCYSFNTICIFSYFALQNPGGINSGTRGRALIISNRCNNTRPGSEHDHDNMRRMLDQFGFITAGEHRNYTAEVVY